METPAPKQMHPLVVIASISVIVFCLIGIGAIMGWIPTTAGHQDSAAQASLAPPAGEVKSPASAEHAAAAQARSAPSETKKAAAASHPKTATKSNSRPAVDPKIAATEMAQPPVQVAQAQSPAPVAQFPPPPPPAQPARTPCADCATIESVRTIEKPGQASGIGAVGGAVAGGVVGNQVGGGRGRDVMTILGAVGGGIAGHQIEKNAKKTVQYEIGVRFDDGRTSVITQETPPSWRPGDKVRIVNGAIQPNG